MDPTSPAYELLHEGLRRTLWDMGWKSLRPLQENAIRAVFSGEQHLILSAATAAGKTEAAFLPILSKIADEPAGSVRAIYVGPLKALINDQFSRVEDLCTRLEFPVHRWHGDVGDSAKSRLLSEPSGVLLITPESLESLFINRTARLGRLFGGLRFAVIDELHSFLDNERGLHLRSLLSRLRWLDATLPPEEDLESGSFLPLPPGEGRGEGLRPTGPFLATEHPLRLVGLSATLGDFAPARRFLDPDRPDDVVLIDDKSDKKELKLRIHAYPVVPTPSSAQGSAEDMPVRAQAPPHTEDPPEVVPTPSSARGSAEAMPVRAPAPLPADDQTTLAMARDIVGHCAGQTNLVFAESKADVEEFADACSRLAAAQRLRDTFVVHHGSLAADIRVEAEESLKSGQPTTAFCSSTLEMGIDIGSVRMVGQIGPPHSVASLKQRVGRSGRRPGEARIFRVYVRCPAPAAPDDFPATLHLPLVQSIAVTQLLLDGWIEPQEPPQCDLSTLTHQIISTIAEKSGRRADALYESLCIRGPFRDIDQRLFAQLLRQLASRDVIEQTAEGDLILGLVGEKLRKDWTFYAAFNSPQEYAIVAGDRTLGKLSGLLAVGDCILFAGQRWRVAELDRERMEARVAPSPSGRASFSGGGQGIHAAVVEKMRQILASAEPAGFLTPAGQEILARARQAAVGLRNRGIRPGTGKQTLLLTWAGSRVQQTLLAMLESHKVSGVDHGIALRIDGDEPAARGALQAVMDLKTTPEQLAESLKDPADRKFDYLLGTGLLNQSRARMLVDVPGAVALAGELLGRMRNA
ncbi:MAG: DEAD/DEAH box helicase [Tepidisphaerales bacterium]